MVLGSRPKVPQDRFVILRKQRKAVGLVLCPGADVRRGDVTHVVHVEAQQRAHFRFSKQLFRTVETFTAQTVKVDALFPINCHCSVSFDSHFNFS